MMASDPRSTHIASVTEVDFRSGHTVRGGADGPDAPGGEFQPPVRYEDYGWQASGVEPPPRRSGRLLQVGAAIAAVAGFVAVVWFAYSWGLERGYRQEIQIVRAAKGPIKVRPENPGGLVVPNQDKLVLNQVPNGEDAPEVERLLSAPESPQLPPETIEALIQSTEEKSAAASEPPQPALAEVEAAAEEPKIPAAPAPQASDAKQAASAEPAAPSAPSEPAAASESAVPAKQAAGAVSGETVTGAATTGGSGSALPAPAAGQDQVASIEDGDFVIQLASVTSDGAAQQEWSRLQRVFPNLLGDMKLAVQVATVKGTEYHRVQTGPFPSRATALDMCAQMKVNNQPCIVQQR